MSAKCKYYNVEVEHHQDPSIGHGRDQVAPHEVRIPWCAHKHSEVTAEDATGFIGGPQLLKCGGDLGKCQVSENLRHDGE